MIYLGKLWDYVCNVPFNDADKRHPVRRIPLLPRVTNDGWLVWLWPCWKVFSDSTDWEGSNWSYVWFRSKKNADRWMNGGK